MGFNLPSTGQALVAMITPSKARNPSSSPTDLAYSRSGVRTHTCTFLKAGKPWKSSITRCRSTAAGQWL
ncbi:hypothetical protein D9M71_686040 [compost metagenome]